MIGALPNTVSVEITTGNAKAVLEPASPKQAGCMTAAQAVALAGLVEWRKSQTSPRRNAPDVLAALAARIEALEQAAQPHSPGVSRDEMRAAILAATAGRPAEPDMSGINREIQRALAGVQPSDEVADTMTLMVRALQNLEARLAVMEETMATLRATAQIKASEVAP
jgi:hypothetical protein